MWGNMLRIKGSSLGVMRVGRRRGMETKKKMLGSCISSIDAARAAFVHSSSTAFKAIMEEASAVDVEMKEEGHVQKRRAGKKTDGNKGVGLEGPLSKNALERVKVLYERLNEHVQAKNKEDAMEVYQELEKNWGLPKHAVSKPVSAKADAARSWMSVDMQQSMERLVVLITKTQPSHPSRACQMLRHIVAIKSYQPTDFSSLAFVFTMDACMKKGMINEALEMYELSLDAQVLLDLQIYQQLTMALLDRKELDDAVQITKDMIKAGTILPTDDIIRPLLEELVISEDYLTALELTESIFDKNPLLLEYETIMPLMTFVSPKKGGFISSIQQQLLDYWKLILPTLEANMELDSDDDDWEEIEFDFDDEHE